MGDWILDANDKMIWDASLPGKKRGERVPSRATPEMIAAIEAKNAEAKALHDAKVAEEEKAKALAEAVKLEYEAAVKDMEESLNTESQNDVAAVKETTPVEKLKSAWKKWSE